jgi:multicomponent Na+:H+ antiporter subunit F
MKAILFWLVGAAVLLSLIAAALYQPLTLEGYLDLPFSGLLSRAMTLLILAALLCLVRVGLGPTAADRIVAIDILGILIVGLCAILTLATGQSWYLDIGIVWALQSFIGSLALAKRLEGRAYDD